MPERKAIFPAHRQDLYEKHRYSAAIRSGDLLFVSGQVGSLEDGFPEPDLDKQVRLAFDNLRATLRAAGCDSWTTLSMSRPSIPTRIDSTRPC